MAATAARRRRAGFEAYMSLSVSGHSPQYLVYPLIQPQAVGGNGGSDSSASGAPAASPASSDSTSLGRAVAVSAVLATFLSGLVPGGQLAAASAQTSVSPAVAAPSPTAPVAAASSSAASSGDLRRQGQNDGQTQASDGTAQAAAPVEASDSGALSASSSTSYSLGAVVAAYVSNMEPASSGADAESARRESVSTSAAAVSHPGSRAAVRDHASAPAGVSAAA
jgi:hypothetical protein